MAAALCALGVSALAQTAIKDAPAAIRKLIDCRKTADNTTRLACYDAAIDEVTASLTKGDIVAVDKGQIAAVKRQAFGFTLPSLSLFDRAEKPAPLENIVGVAASAYHRAGDTWVIELEDGGGTWVQTDVTEHVARDPHKGSKIEIRKASLGSYFMNIDGQRALRVKRTQ